jgi:competence protein ComEC
MRKIRPFFLWISLLLFSILSRAQEDSVMCVHYINVGQAASALLEFPCGAILIDAGAADDTYHNALMAYLGHFFQRRKDLDSTLALVMITHPHIDHNEVLKDIVRNFHVLRYIDDGKRIGSGKPNQVWLQDTAAKAHIQYESYSFEQITHGGNKDGMTDSIIDPINCKNGDPQIILYSGQFETQPDGWSATDFKNYNNHSLVIKVIFGQASFLFTGDLETKGIASVVSEYSGTPALHADVLLVGHHGAANATTDDYLNEVKPSYAVISCGAWDAGKGGTDRFTTWFYGHPRINTINLLDAHITGNRPQPVEEMAAEGAQNFRNINITKSIYATPWDNTVIIKATLSGHYTVTTNN